MSKDKGGPTPPDLPEGAIHPLPDEFRKDLKDYAIKQGDVDIEFENRQVFPLQSIPNHSNFSYFATSCLQNLENISSSNCILVYTNNYI